MKEYRIVKLETFFVSGQMQDWEKEIETFAGDTNVNEINEIINKLNLNGPYTVEYRLEGREKRKWNEITKKRIKPPRGCQTN